MLWQSSNFAGNSQHPDCRKQTSYQNLHHANRHGKCRRDRFLETKTGIYPMPVVKSKMKIDQPDTGLGSDTWANIITEMLKQQQEEKL